MENNMNGSMPRPGVACAPVEVVAPGDGNVVAIGRTGIGMNRDVLCFAAGVGFTLLTIWLISQCNGGKK